MGLGKASGKLLVPPPTSPLRNRPTVFKDKETRAGRNLINAFGISLPRVQMRKRGLKTPDSPQGQLKG